MVTLITEKLQSQSLDDLTCKAEAGPLQYSAETLNKSGRLFPLELNDQSPWKVFSGGRLVGRQAATGPDFSFLPGLSAAAHTMGLQWQPEYPGPGAGLGAASTVDPSESTGLSTAPPTKRHCRSLSEPEELVCCWSPWRPGSSKVWTPVSKRRCNSGGSATLQGSPSAVLPRGAVWLAGPTLPATPRPSSASSGFVDSSEGSAGSGALWCSAESCLLPARRRLSLSQEQLAGVGTPLPSASSSPTSTPELGRLRGLLRCRSQPCVLSGKRSRCKRRREEDARWTRPSLDFLKMTRTLKNSKSLCSLNYEDDDEDDTPVKTVLSSPCDSRGLPGITMPGCSQRGLRTSPAHPNLWASRESVTGDGSCRSNGDPSDGDSAGEEGIFPRARGELDLEQIENN
ncbi:protein FAM53A [Pongo pygmaeus]|uniref:FAM53A isoform 2 n=2 Tax=Pongo abelii TaxID=9601 RepID=A0A6D2XC18_PONAB|nr:protein FAM53A [Pongo pygmaeus]XP_054342756.1 protein FAM53A [Pongo pygmaeus]XP_054342757.1 protein FAM53A [Pongo pygmaeus]XP_054342758.1 protein FAM53A [Pongo pygmaeus]XP_054342759.1 protein FAM53A [Pongo pygmaeus]XP_054342760.1 protein FAM53A [Pongo pygmaeus]XP_054342762.1 protein FAM53A [Pongo pygmaeus]XP_054342763.1 protein FAM53A [Pongo pygmaeus]XP_054342764.1 protein FAM53A [Pongo pygmaeus]PNJ23580.1 FAM53A isoform 2 [Pongo abelii]PNJ23582.1 FAM53A isoform 4 [Pongo abelii]PNJ235